MTWPQVRNALPWEWQQDKMHLFASALTTILMSLSLLLTGPGRFSLDRLIFAKHHAD